MRIRIAWHNMRFAEELLLLLFDDERGDLTGTLPPGRLDILLPGGC